MIEPRSHAISEPVGVAWQLPEPPRRVKWWGAAPLARTVRSYGQLVLVYVVDYSICEPCLDTVTTG